MPAPTVAELRSLVTQRGPAQPRVPPGRRAEIGVVNHAISAIAGRVTRTGPLNVFSTLAHNRWVFRRWLVFAGALMPGGRLPRKDTELVILRVASNCGSAYEWFQHVPMGLAAGLTPEQVAAIPQGSAGGVWSDRQRALLDATDELAADRVISDDTWAALRPELRDRDLIELCMLAGHYEMLAGALNSLGVQVER